MPRWLLCAALLCWGSLPTLGLALTAEEIVQKADEVRTPARQNQDFVWTVTVTTMTGGKATETNAYEVFVKGFGQVFVKFIAPPREIGRSLLALDRDLWIYLPSAGKPVRIPLSQRLVGQVANGDIARVNYAGDYHAALAGDETVKSQGCTVLTLTAKTKEVTYASIRYWVARDSFKPVKAEFYTLSGKLLKTGYWDNEQIVHGGLRPTRLTLVDGIKTESQSILDYTHFRLQDLPDKMFNKNYMKQLD
jgi:hypothetical protein